MQKSGPLPKYGPNDEPQPMLFVFVGCVNLWLLLKENTNCFPVVSLTKILEALFQAIDT